ncbi:flagellar filament capping protein FliD [Alicyclobacillus shizuokensis]|uniref:flagellar filament capping protein FliD n=1 Tax=Alicyclobacillus shizuokensis TaxID=392014 RepID=UPI00083761D9|nr:flagellar filament capping protein FliD [Alicyclobacillus shizuokensis]
MTYIGALSGGYSGGGSSASGINQATYTLGSGLSGLASGVDTDSIVNAMVQAAQVPLVQLLQQRQILQWQEMRYQQVNASLTQLQNTVQSMQLQSTFMAHSVTSSNTSVVTGSATTLAANGTYSVTVNRLAQGATVVSTSPVTANLSTETVGDVNGGNGITLNINGQTLQFSASDTLQSVLSSITSNTATGVSAFADPNTGSVVLQTSSTGGAAKIQVDSQTYAFLSAAFNLGQPQSLTTKDLSAGLAQNTTIQINGQTITLQAGWTAADIAAAVNQYSSTTGVSAQVNGDGTLTLNPYETDSTTGTTYDLLSLISVDDPSGALGLPSYSATDSQRVAQNAEYTINGYTTTSPTNQATYNGLTLNLYSTGSANVTVGTDVDSIVNAITNFVQQYNQTLQLMQGLYNEQRNYDYQPLTAQQASQMTQDQIEKWNEQAQSGMLANDPLLGSIMDTLENDMQLQLSGQTQSTVNGQTVTLNTLASIGITPIDPLTGVSSGATAPGVTTTGWNTYGLLQIDTDQLRAAIQADPQAVMRLFTNNPQISSGSSMGTGVAVQLYNDLSNSIQQLTDEAGSNPNILSEIQTQTSNGTTISGAGLLPYTLIDPNADFSTLFGSDSLDISFLGQQISGMDSEAEDMQQQISDLQQRYQNEFSQMEQAIAQLSTQSSYLSSLFGSSSSSS